MFNKNGFIVWLPVVRILYLMTQKGPTIPYCGFVVFFFFLNVDFYSHRLVSVHTQYLLFTTQIETGLQQQQSDLA